MTILAIKTDQPQAYVGLIQDGNITACDSWEAHRQLAATLYKKIDELLTGQNVTLKDMTGIVCFKGPGSFTGLRIGLSAANALSYVLQIPVVSTEGAAWIDVGVARLDAGEDEKVVLPFYGADAHITQPKK